MAIVIATQVFVYPMQMEILELIINLSIALISVIISIYAISVSLLGSHLETNERFIKKRIAETDAEIVRIRNDGPSSAERLKQINEEIKEFETEKKKLDNILTCLSLNGAVILPIIPFVSLLILGAMGIYSPSNSYLVIYFSPVPL